MNEFKVKVTDNGNLIISTHAMIESLSDEDREELAKDFAFHSTMYNEIKRHILDEWAGPGYNDEIHRIRLEFLTGEDADKRVRDLVGQLLTHLKQAEKQLKIWEETYWKMYHTWNETYNRGSYGHSLFPIERPEHISLEFVSDKEVKEYISEQTN